MGGEFLVGLNREVRQAAGVEAGDGVRVVLKLDTDVRDVEVPDDLAAALAQHNARARFDALAFTHRKEYVRWVTEAKRDDTRRRRIDQAVEMILAGKTRS
jgi:uncharacterized protein YdeI (YjbR/CyaY-like superfamily)